MFKRKGFTVVELLVVIIIVGIIAVAVSPGLSISNKKRLLIEKCFHTVDSLSWVQSTKELDNYIEECKHIYPKVASDCNLNVNEVEEKGVKKVLNDCINNKNLVGSSISVVYSCYKDNPKIMINYYNTSDEWEKNNIIKSAYNKCFPENMDIAG